MEYHYVEGCARCDAIKEADMELEDAVLNEQITRIEKEMMIKQIHDEVNSTDTDMLLSRTESLASQKLISFRLPPIKLPPPEVVPPETLEMEVEFDSIYSMLDGMGITGIYDYKEKLLEIARDENNV